MKPGKGRDDNLTYRGSQPSADLRVEGLSLYAPQFQSVRQRQVTASFRVMNAGKEAIAKPFRASVFAVGVKPDGQPHLFDTHYVNTPALAAGQTVYVSHTVAVPGGVNEFDIRVEADPDHTVTRAEGANRVAASHFKNPTPAVGRWVSIGPTRITSGLGAVGRLTTIAIHPTSPATIYAGARGCGVWKTTDGGSSWQPIADSLPTLTIQAIAIDPSAPSRLHIVTPVGVFSSEDDGTSWTQTYSGDLNAIGPDGGALLIDPNNPDVLYLTSFDGVYRSSNRGATWSLALSGGWATSLVMDRANPNSLYAALFHPTNHSITGVYATTDGGSNWWKLAGCPDGSLPTVSDATTIRLALSGERLYASYKTPSSWTLYRTTEASCSVDGRSEKAWEAGWSPTGSIGTNPIYKRLWSWLHADPTDPRYVYAGGTDLWFSTNGGTSFQRATEPHVDHHGFALDPIDPKIIYTGCDGGIYRSSDRGKKGTWTFVGEGIANVEFYDIADAATEPNLVIGGTQDNGTSKYDGTSTVWKYVTGGDSESVEIDPTNAQTLYEIGQYMDQMQQSTDGGRSWTGIGSGLPADCDIWLGEYPSTPGNSFQVHPSSPSILLATGHSLWRGLPWTAILTPSSGNVVRSAVDRTANLYYAGTDRGELYAGRAGTNWRMVFSHRSQRSVFDIEVDLDDPETVYVAFDGTGTDRVYRLRRASPTPTTMTAVDVTANLPIRLKVQTLAVDRMSPLTIFAGTDHGVYRGRSTDGGGTWSWTPYNDGLPSAVDVRDLEVHPVTGVMRAATFGRGALEVNTDFPIGSLLTAEGTVTLLRVHDAGTGYGPPTDFIDVEVVIWLDSQPGKAFGFQLRNDANESAHRGMLELLRKAFKRDGRVRIDYVRAGFRNGRILRVMDIL